MIFRVGGVTLSSRLVEGRFPNYKQLLPRPFEHELHVSGPEVLEVVRRISLLAQKNAPLRMRFADGTLEVSAQTPDIGEASESLRSRSRARRWRSASTRSSCATAWRAPSPTTSSSS